MTKNPEKGIVQELEPFLKFKPEISSIDKLAKARLNLKLALEIEHLRMSMKLDIGSDQASVVVVAPENLDETSVFDEKISYKTNGLAGNYGIAPKSSVQKFYGHAMPIYKANDESQ